MDLQKQNVTLRVLRPSEGHLLMRVGAEFSTAYFADVVYLGVNDNENNYVEVDADAVRAELARRKTP